MHLLTILAQAAGIRRMLPSYKRPLWMAKFKPAKGKSKSRAAPQGGLPCVILLGSGFALVLFFLYFVMKYAN